MKKSLTILLSLLLLLITGATAFAEGEGQPFQPEKPIEMTGSGDNSYTLVYDDAYFSNSSVDGVDEFTWRNQPEGDYPRCFMSIHRVNGFTLDEVVQGLIIQEDIEGAVNEDDLDGQPMKVLRMCEGTTAKSRVVEYNCLSLNDSGVLIVEMDWFVEAEEGIGARLLAMRDTIQLAPSTATAVQP